MDRNRRSLSPVVGAYSGVSYERLKDTPNLEVETILEWDVDALVRGYGGMEKGVGEGHPFAAAAGDDLDLAMPALPGGGDYTLSVNAAGSEGAGGTAWIEVDGTRLGESATFSSGPFRERVFPARVAPDGPRNLVLALRGARGVRLRSLKLVRQTVRVAREPMGSDPAARRPRLFLGPADLEVLRRRVRDPVAGRYYRPAGVLEGDPPPFEEGKRNGGPFRQLPAYALSHLLEPEPAKLGRLIAWLEMASTYPHVGADLDAEYFVEGVALAYDWLHEELPESLRAAVRSLLCRQAEHVYGLSRNGRTGGGLSFQQNHYWFAHLSLALAAAAVYGESDRARSWLAWAWDRAERIFMTFSPDGGFHEGPAYWDFSMPTLYMLVDLYEGFTGLRVPSADQGLPGQAVFRLHHMLPGMSRTVLLEDTTAGTTRPPAQLALWEARRYRDPVAMGIARRLVREPSTHAFHLLWLDETVPEQDPTGAVPTGAYYPDIETGFARTSWDDGAAYIAVVSRPLGGHFWAEMCDRFGLGGTGHNHPEQGHFVLFGRGEILAHDPGYTYEKRTRNHNTILVDGAGQYGCGEMWPSPKPGRARMTGMAFQGDIAILAADPAPAYPPELGLSRFERICVLAGPDLAVVHDRLAADRPRTFSWLLHHIGRAEPLEGDLGWRITRGGAQLGVTPLRPRPLPGESSTYLPVYIHPVRNLTPREDAEIGLLELKAGPVADATFLVPLVIGNAGQEIPGIEDLCDEGMDALRVGDTVVAFNRGRGEIRVPVPGGEPLVTDARAAVVRVRGRERTVVTLERETRA